MMPWWAVLITCAFFGIWSVFCFMVGASMKDYALKETAKRNLITKNMNN
jgi:hypothetical protein